MKDQNGSRPASERPTVVSLVWSFLRRRRGLILAPLIPALVAGNCGGGLTCGGLNNPCDFTIAPDPPNATVIAGSSVGVKIKLTRSLGFNEAVAVTLSGTDVSADALSIAASSSEGILTVRASASASPGTRNVTITGASGSLNKIATLGLTITPTPTVIVTPKTLTVAAFAGAPATTFTAALTNSAGPVTWALSGPGSISSATGASTNYTPPTSATSAATATLTASVTGASAAATITINPGTVTVAGKVISTTGEAVSGASVRIGTVSTTSSSDGSFSVPNVSLPYNASVVTTSGSNKQANVFQGLTRSDPILQLFLSGFPAPAVPRSATISGNLSGGAGFPNPANHTTAVFFASPDTAFTAVSRPAGPSYGPFTVNWAGPTTTSGKLYALQWQRDASTNLPVSYKGFASADQTLSDGGAFGPINLALSNTTQNTLSGTLSVPAVSGVTLTKYVFLRLPPNAGIDLLSDNTNTTSFSYQTPNISDATITVAAGADISPGGGTYGWKTGLATNATGVNLPIDSLPTLSSPSSGASNVTINQTFQVASVPSGSVRVFFISGGTLSYAIVTSADTVQIPDLSAQGMAFPTSGAVSFSWNVRTFKPFASVDAATGSTGYVAEFIQLFYALFGAGPGPASDGGLSFTTSRTFTTP